MMCVTDVSFSVLSGTVPKEKFVDCDCAPPFFSARGVGSGDGRTTPPPKAPTVEMIEELGPDNAFLQKEELELMSSETFSGTVETLRKVTDFSPDQLAKLKEKAVEVL